MIISLLPLFLIMYRFYKFSCDQTFALCPFHICPFANYFVFVFLKTTLLPFYISASLRNTHSFFKYHFSRKTKNVSFYALVLHILIIISGSVELNPGPDMSKKSNFSFAVWNLDRDFSRIPLIESLQNTYNFDMFGVCEFMLTGCISNEDIFINGFCPSPFRSDKSSTTRNGGVRLYFKESLPIKE